VHICPTSEAVLDFPAERADHSGLMREKAMAIVAILFAAGMLERWGIGFVNGGVLGAVIGLVIAVILKCTRSGR
jgi:hypothetical protein